MKKVLLSAVALAMTATAANATSINMRHEYVPEYDGQKAEHLDRVAVSHRFANGVGFEVEAKWASAKDESPFDLDTFNGNGQQANISYRHKLNDAFTLTPQYKWESGDEKMGHQFNLTLGYKINSDWSSSFRHRYHYEIKDSGDTTSHYNRWTLGLGYKGIDDWNLSGSLDYTFNPEASGARWEDKQSWFSELNFKAEYKWGDGWYPFAELGFKPYKSGEKYTFDNGKYSTANDEWRPRVRVGMKYSF